MESPITIHRMGPNLFEVHAGFMWLATVQFSGPELEIRLVNGYLHEVERRETYRQYARLVGEMKES